MLIRRTIIAVALVAGSAANAADALFPPGSRIGLAPPAGMTMSKAFPGFEDRDKNAAIAFAELSADAYPELEKQFSADALKAQSVAVQGREDVPLQHGRGFLVMTRQEYAGASHRKWIFVAIEDDLTALVTLQVPDAVQDSYPDALLRASLATLATREVPVQEQLDILPFTLKDLAGFRIVHAAAGGALLTEGPKNVIDFADQPLLFIGLHPETAEQASDRESVARRAISGTPGFKEMRLRRSEEMRIGGHAGHEMLIDAHDAKTDAEVTLVQWLRFGSGGSVRMLAAARKDQWDKFYPRFRAVRDGLDGK